MQPKCLHAGLKATTEPQRLSLNKLQIEKRNHERPFSPCSCHSPVCVLFPACGSNTHRNRCLIDWLRPERVSKVIYVWSESGCVLLSSLVFSHLPVFPAICLLLAYSSICQVRKQLWVSSSRLLLSRRGQVETAQDGRLALGCSCS